MSTSAIIGIENDDGSYDSIWCHYDGYPSYCLAMLTKHYNTKEKVQQLLKHGNVRMLMGNIKASTFYDGEVSKHHSTIDRFYTDSYGYVFKNDEWHVVTKVPAFLHHSMFKNDQNEYANDELKMSHILVHDVNMLS